MCRLCSLDGIIGNGAVHCPAVDEAVCMYHCYHDCNYGRIDGRCTYISDKRAPEILSKINAAMPESIRGVVWAHADLRKPEVLRRYNEFKKHLGKHCMPLTDEERIAFDRLEVIERAKADAARRSNTADDNGTAGGGAV